MVVCPVRIRGDGWLQSKSPRRLSTPEPRGTKNAPNWAFTLSRAYCVHVPASLKLRSLPLLAASSWGLDGAGEGNRTRDLRITSAPLYQLSYAGPLTLRKCYVISSACVCQSTDLPQTESSSCRGFSPSQDGIDVCSCIVVFFLPDLPCTAFACRVSGLTAGIVRVASPSVKGSATPASRP